MPVIVGLILRHLLSGVGGALATHGVIASSEVEAFIGIGTALASAALSWLNKKRTGQV